MSIDIKKIRQLINPEFRDSLIRGNIHAFTQRVFQHINPGIRYQSNWHIDLIMEKLEAVEQGGIKRLIINMPPRSLKSICASVAFPAWVLARAPHKRIITTSYSLQLAKKHAQDCRGVVSADWYQALFPATQISRDQNDKLKFQTTEFGFRLATSVGGTLTGEGGDIIILDDPINAAQAQSPVLREKVSDWYQQTLVSRLDDKTSGAIVLVMQRFHPEDLSGELLKASGWEHLNLPLIASEKKTYSVGGKNIVRQPGELLHANRDTKDYAEQLKSEIGAFAFEAQYQQSPIIQQGSMIRREWFGRYDLNVGTRSEPVGESALSIGEANSPCTRQESSTGQNKDPVAEHGDIIIVQSWDTAIKSSPNSDYSVCITARLRDGISEILDVHCDRIEYPALKKRVQQQAERFNPHHILIEDKASGQQLVQDLRGDHQLPIIPIMPRGDKFSRLSAATGMIEAGKVSLPNRAPWLGDFLAEALGYPNVKHDDQIDALAQYLNWLRNKPKGKLSIRSL